MADNRKRILLVGTYPVKNPQHGGQKRVSALIEQYRNAGFDARYCAVFYAGFYPYYSRDDITVGLETEQKIRERWYLGDLYSGEAIFTDERVKTRMTKLLQSFQPDIIQIEQTFPYLGLQPLLSELGLNPILVMSSHNIEYTMKVEMLESMGLEKQFIKDIGEQIESVERALAKRAKLVAAVTPSDVRALKALGATEVTLAPNGIGKSATSSKDLLKVQNLMAEHGWRRYVLFVGAAHPPNWLGFEAMVGDALGFLPPDTGLVLAGSIAEYFQDNYKGGSLGKITFWQRAYAAGRVSEPYLAALLEKAEIMILPLTEGGGSNLKTAEAILANHKIVATPFAFRSYENYLNLPNIWLADTRPKFVASIAEALDTPIKERTEKEQLLAEKVQWQYTLAEFVKGVTKL